jgi:peptidoglycan/xylan/chitin deacetylase (PgdA/CDA1 family)
MYNLGAFAPFRLLTRDKILILTYHRFSLEANPHRISRAEFAAHLEYLSKNNRVLSLSETLEYLQNGKSLPPNTTVITIDDGYSDAYEIAFPLLKKFNLPATVYAVTDFLDQKCWLWTDLMRYVFSETEKASRVNSRLKTLPDEEKKAEIERIAEDLNVEIPALPVEEFAPIDWRQAREMDAENVRIESHTVTHPILPNVSENHLSFELKNSKKRLEEVLNRRVEHFCYPNGSLNKNVQTAVENAGYKCAVTTNYGFNGKETNRFLLNRIDAQASIANFAQSASGFEALKQKII